MADSFCKVRGYGHLDINEACSIHHGVTGFLHTLIGEAVL